MATRDSMLNAIRDIVGLPKNNGFHRIGYMSTREIRWLLVFLKVRFNKTTRKILVTDTATIGQSDSQELQEQPDAPSETT